MHTNSNKEKIYTKTHTLDKRGRIIRKKKNWTRIDKRKIHESRAG